jgi:hypothetical protein
MMQFTSVAKVSNSPTGVSGAALRGRAGAQVTIAFMHLVRVNGESAALHSLRAHTRTVRAAQWALGLLALLVGTAAADAQTQEAGSASALRAAYASRQGDIAGGKKDLPLSVRSSQTDDALQGDIHALIDQPFSKVREALSQPRNWCEVLILHPNVKDCRQGNGAAGAPSLALSLGRSEVPAQFTWRVASSTSDYLDIRLGAPEGPFGTTDYRVRLEATPLDERNTIVHLAYSHRYGMRAKVAMQTYFKTLGRGKVGFSVVRKDTEGKPVYVTDLRGGLERNAMRYYASIESYLISLSAPPDQQLEQRLRNWFAYTERHPLQLQEEPGYLEQKRREAKQIQTG